MSNTGLFGPFALISKEVDDHVGKGPGTYVLGHSTTASFIVEYVGRSDTDLNKRLKDWCPTAYQQFKYGHFDAAKDAFNKECRIFHEFGGTAKLDNKIHPDRPDGSDWKCPVCDVFD